MSVSIVAVLLSMFAGVMLECDIESVREQAVQGIDWTEVEVDDELIIDLHKLALRTLNKQHKLRKFKRGQILEAYTQENDDSLKLCVAFTAWASQCHMERCSKVDTICVTSSDIPAGEETRFKHVEVSCQLEDDRTTPAPTITTLVPHMPESCSCHVGGDPIVETFNGKRLLLEGVGIFNIFTNGEPGSDEYIRVDVETFQKDWNYPAWIIINSVTVYYRDIAIHISTSSVTLSNDAGTLESDLSNELPYRDPTYDFLVNGTVGDTTSFMTSSGVKVILSSSDDISVEVMLPRDQLFSPVGACRTCDGDPSTDFILNGKDITNEPRKYLMMSRAFLVSDTLA